MSRTAAPLSLSALVELVQDLAADPSTWAPRLERHPDRRWWTRLAGDDTVDVWLITWPGGGSTDLHDHGSSSAAFTVVEGVLEEVRPEPSGGLEAADLREGQVQWVAPGVVHDVRNATSTPAASIHAYSPPLEQMTYYRRAPGGLEPAYTITGDEPEQAW
ncbi:mannose-6-phosphate isomerase-like protein (cupin superfamily) [Motilibacter peucedani]|uniref:Mannose-6-phosphate isomerase-like protein (Cupin superfamily) n=1 Tax=Motilibacter peucedani TaxID=598650 RepID=A0A420XL04_9ACTN|nr:cysteine dioxygenase family protein [Motilibacter peucedani]RKS69220.1 mannose-6-phosphate isomerase-like protein (cupin superfamily) [Motilibacter peucedani]